MKFSTRARNAKRELINALGLDYTTGRPRWGKWVVTNFLWNTMPWKHPRRYRVLRWAYDRLRPILNPERTYPKGGSQ